METKQKTLAECRQVYQTNAALGHRQLAYLIRLDESKNGYNYLCIDKNCETDSYTLGELVSDLSDIYVEECDYDLMTSPIYKDFLFYKFITTELYAGQTKQSEPVSLEVDPELSDEDLRKYAKKVCAYERQIQVFGQQAADNMLQTATLAMFKYRDERKDYLTSKTK